MKILIIEDTEIDILIAEKIIKSVDKDIEVDSVESIAEAFIYLENTEPMPDVLLLDLILPVKDGFHFLEKISHNERLNKIPVYIYTSSIHSQDKQKATAYSNVKGYIDKPINKSNVEEMRTLLDQ